MPKSLLILFALFSLVLAPIAPAQSNEDLEERLSLLEAKVKVLSEVKLSDCQLALKFYRTVLNSCPRGTVIGKVFLLASSGPIQVDCYQYTLACKVGGEIVNMPLTETSE
jgi:hypothetical protein